MIRLYGKLIGVCYRSQMQYPTSFWMLTSALFLGTFVDILAIWALFDRFHLIQEWTFPELALIYGIMHMGFAMADATARGFDNFGATVKQGDFDRVLLRPLGSLFQIATRELHLIKIGRFLQGAVVFGWGYSELQMSAFHLPLMLFCLLGTSCLFYGLYIMQATFSFWTTETLELMNIVTYGGMESGQYPMTIYPPFFRGFFTFIISLATVVYYPIATLLHHESMPLWAAFSLPISGVFFLGISMLFWKLGVQKYQSTGS